MSDYIERDKAIEAIAEHLMGEAVLEYPDASDNIEDWKEIGEAILENIPPAEVIPKGSDEASLAYAEGWKNGEEAERSRRPKGEWIFKTVFPNDKSEFPMGYLVCSVCGSHHSNSTPCNYCDNCGARMKGADDE